MYNFDVIRMKAVKEDTTTLIMLEKGELDFIGMSKDIYQKSNRPKWVSKLKK